MDTDPKRNNASRAAVKTTALALALLASASLAKAAILPSVTDTSEVANWDVENDIINHSHTVTAGSNQMLLVGVGVVGAGGNAVDIDSVSFGATPMNQTITRFEADTRVNWYYLPLGSPGTDSTSDVTIDYAGTGSGKQSWIVAMTLRNVAQQAPETVAGTGSQVDVTNFTSNLNLTTLTDNALLISAVGAAQNDYANNNASFTADSGQTVLYSLDKGRGAHIAGWEVIPTAGSITDTYSGTSTGTTFGSRAHTAMVFAAIPEPSTLLLMVTALVGLGLGLARRSRR